MIRSQARSCGLRAAGSPARRGDLGAQPVTTGGQRPGLDPAADRGQPLGEPLDAVAGRGVRRAADAVVADLDHDVASVVAGGQQQLVAVARALISKPTLILADEPTGNLHTAQGREIMELFTRLNQEGVTIIQVTHSEANAEFGSRIVKLRDGWVVDH